MSRQAKLARLVRGTTLGDDTLAAMPEDQWRAELLASTKRVEANQQSWFAGDLFWKRLGVIATVTIPLSAAIWRAIGVGRKRKRRRD